MNPGSTFGTLQMPTAPEAVDAAAALWSDVLTNRIAVVVSLILVLFFFKDILDILPSIGNCFTLKHGHIHLEHNRSLARCRNQIAWILSVPFAMVLDRYGIFRPEFFSLLPLSLELPVMYGMLLLYAAVHSLLYFLISTRIHGEEKDAASNVIFVYLIPLTVAMLATCGILSLAGAGNSAVRTALLLEISAVFLISLFKTGQIFGGTCGLFSTFLYLCALEIVPAAIFVASAIVF